MLVWNTICFLYKFDKVSVIFGLFSLPGNLSQLVGSLLVCFNCEVLFQLSLQIHISRWPMEAHHLISWSTICRYRPQAQSWPPPSWVRVSQSPMQSLTTGSYTQPYTYWGTPSTYVPSFSSQYMHHSCTFCSYSLFSDSTLKASASPNEDRPATLVRFSPSDLSAF